MDFYLGEIRMTSFNFAPQGWALCNGQQLLISQNPALFSLMGTQYGGNGITNFSLPNLQGRVPIHQGQSAGTSLYLIGQEGGQESVTLQPNQMPAHTHSAATQINASSAAATTVNPAGNLPATPARPEYAAAGAAVAMANTAAATTLSVAGDGQAHTNVQPYLTVNFIIALTGIYPPRQ